MRVAIVGAGVGGPTLAHWLRRYGHEPVLIEKAPALRTGGYVIDFWGLGYDVAERMGAIPAIRALGYDIRELRIVDGAGHVSAHLELEGFRQRVGERFVSVARSDLAEALFATCEGIEARFGLSVAALAQDPDGVDVTFTDGATERFDLLVGADGLHSKVRALAFDGPDPEVPLGCGVAAYRIAGYPHRDELTYLMHTLPRHQIARVSLRDDETLVLLIWRTEGPDDHPPADAPRPWLRERFADLGWEAPELLARLDDAEDFYVDRVSQIRLDRWSAGRVALLGDAAACASLLAGEGTGLAMTEAYVLAGELHRAPDVPSALRAYEERLRSFVHDKQVGAEQFRGFFVPSSRFWQSVRDLAVNAMRVPGLGGWLLSRELRDDLVLPDYAP